MARQRASACLSVALWVWCASVCVADTKDLVHPKGLSTTRPAAAATSSSVDANITSPTPTPSPPAVTRQKPLLTTDGGVDGGQEAEVQNSSGREAASKRNTSVQGGLGRDTVSSSSPTAEQLKSATSLAGNLALLLISVVIAGALFIMVVCFIHKWKENMGTG